MASEKFLSTCTDGTQPEYVFYRHGYHRGYCGKCISTLDY